MWNTYGAARKDRWESGHTNYCWKLTVSGVGGIQDTANVSAQTHYLMGAFVSVSGTEDISFALTNTGATGTVSKTFEDVSSFTRAELSFKTGSGTSLKTQIAPANPCTFYFDDFYIIPLDTISISGVPASKADSKMPNYDGDLNKAIRVDGGDTLTFSGESFHLTASSGSLGAWFKLPYDYDQIEQDVYFFSMENFLRCYLDSDDHKIHYDVYTISGWGDITLESAVTWGSGWHHVAIGWDNTDAIAMSLDSGNVVSYSGTWTAQSLPAQLFVGSDYNEDYQLDGIVDDVFDHNQKLGDTYLMSMSDARRRYLHVNSFLINEQDASLVRKNVGATR